MSIASQAAVISAYSQLMVVNSVRQAMQNADRIVAARNQHSALPPSASRASQPAAFRKPVQPVQCRQHVIYRKPPHPAVAHARPSHLAIAPANCRPSPSPCLEKCDRHSRPEHQPLTLQAPWQALPWPKHLEPLKQFKKHPPTPDTFSTGMFLDLFV